MEPLTNSERVDWNNFQTHIENSGGSKMEMPGLLDGYKKVNPSSTLTSDHIVTAVGEVNSLKDGKPIAGMNASQAAYIQSGMPAAYKNDASNLSYPVSASHGVDLEGHATDNGPKLPAPNYADPVSRLNYAKQFTQKYGPYMQGRGDTPLRVNEIPENGQTTAKEMAIKAAKPLGLNPSLLYSSAMEEGMSGLFPDKKGEVDFSGNEKFPVNGFYNFGLDDFSDKVPALIKKGYLSSDFKDQFVPKQRVNELGRTVNSADFKTPDSALQAKAAIVKDFQDQTESYAKKNNITLSPKAKEFFSLVAYNSGSGNMQKMMAEYQKKNLLTDDKVDKDPTGHWSTISNHISRRLAMRDALVKEGLF